EHVADDLRRYRNGESLRDTRPVGKAERVWRWCRRKPALAAVGSLALAALIAVCVAVSFAIYHAGAFATYQSKMIRDQQVQLAESALNTGLAQCTDGKVSEGMLWLPHRLE